MMAQINDNKVLHYVDWNGLMGITGVKPKEDDENAKLLNSYIRTDLIVNWLVDCGMSKDAAEGFIRELVDEL